jgi:hypothetical protein
MAILDHQDNSPMQDDTIIPRLSAAVNAGDTAAVRDILTRHLAWVKEEKMLQYFLRDAACLDNVEMVELLVEFGADIHAPDGHGSPPMPEGVISDAAGSGALNVVRWLLERGAKINFEIPGYPGESRCAPLTGAVFQGHLEVVKLLVEQGGANINALWGPYTPLSYALMYGQKEVEAYLRSKGALEPWQLRGDKPPGGTDPILAHIEKHLGKPNPLALREIVSSDPPITIHAVPMSDRLALVTTGMSTQPMTVPPGGEEYRFAELLIYLPKDWPLADSSLRDPNHFWPIDWLRRIARYPHEHHTWLGGPSAVIANDEPPQPLAPNTRLTCLLATTEAGEFGSLSLPDGRRVVFYTLFPLYTEERDLEKEKGTAHLVRLFQKRKIGIVVDVNRPNVAAGSGRRRSGSGRG